MFYRELRVSGMQDAFEQERQPRVCSEEVDGGPVQARIGERIDDLGVSSLGILRRRLGEQGAKHRIGEVIRDSLALEERKVRVGELGLPPAEQRQINRD